MKVFDDTAESEFPKSFRLAESDRLQAARNADAAAMAELMAPGMRYIREDGQVLSRDAYLAEVASGAIGYDPGMSIDDEHNHQEQIVFVIIGMVTVPSGSDGVQPPRRTRYSATWIRQEAGWRVLLVQKTPLHPDVS